MAHKTSPIKVLDAVAGVRISGFESLCSCGLVLRSSLRSIIDRDVWEHVDWSKRAAKAR